MSNSYKSEKQHKVQILYLNLQKFLLCVNKFLWDKNYEKDVHAKKGLKILWKLSER